MARQFHIDALLGEGAFGRVYAARVVTAGGFSKRVALKRIKDDLPAEAVARYRDEARILGLVHDRAVVHAEPPVQLGGRHAVILELVDGHGLDALADSGAPPPAVVAELGQEIARCLDNVYHQAGPDGEPLHLLHRDLKPENVRVTGAGEVKLLDFGAARADFAMREAHTRSMIAGTLGYLPPERLEGEEGPAGDVYSLGVLLHELATGDRPDPEGRFPWDRGRGVDGPAEPLLALAAHLRDPDPARRPSAAEVEAACRRLDVPGPTLRAWARTLPPPSGGRTDDPWVGEVLSEDGAGPRTRRPWVLAVVAVAAASAMAVLGVGLAGVGLLLLPGGAAPTCAARPLQVQAVGATDPRVRVDGAPLTGAVPAGPHEVVVEVGECPATAAGCFPGVCPPGCWSHRWTVDVPCGEGPAVARLWVPPR